MNVVGSSSSQPPGNYTYSQRNQWAIQREQDSAAEIQHTQKNEQANVHHDPAQLINIIA